MKNLFPLDRLDRFSKNSTPLMTSTCLLAAGLLGLNSPSARASIAYGSINNFDTVNDTGVQTHGFEIELDDIHSTDVTYTYDWNHYGTPKITEDMVLTGGIWHTNVHVRYEAVWTNTGWSAYTAVPAGPIPPTQGHQFTNPGTNFGGEHFGCGFRIQPSTVKYNWLIDSGSHSLTLGPAVSVSTPTFTYFPPVPAVAPAQVQAAIKPRPRRSSMSSVTRPGSRKSGPRATLIRKWRCATWSILIPAIRPKKRGATANRTKSRWNGRFCKWTPWLPMAGQTENWLPHPNR